MHIVKVNNRFTFEITGDQERKFINGAEVKIDTCNTGNDSWNLISSYKSYSAELVSLDKASKTAVIKVNNNIYTLSAKDQFDILLDTMGLGNLNNVQIREIKAPMPGLVLKTFVKDGMEISKGDNILILEAMKMENIIKAPADAVIRQIKVKPGDKVEKGQVMLML